MILISHTRCVQESLMPRRLAVLLILALPVMAFCDSAAGPVDDVRAVLHSSAHDVAVQMAVLRATDKNSLVRGLSFSRDGNHLAMESSAEGVRIWDLAPR